ncbi:MAG: hypothetical protein ACFHX7_21950 [Pseudomonadota bacterium]
MLLSHRLRGFGSPELSAGALHSACHSSFDFLEIDTRRAKNDIVVAHDPSIRINGRSIPISDLDVDELNEHGVMALSRAFDIFRTEKQVGQKICIDIKDFGDESRYLDLVHQYGIENSVVFVSWMPSCLVELHRLDQEVPLVLSFISLLRLGRLGLVVDQLVQHSVFRLGHIAVFGDGCADEGVARYPVGFQHGLFSSCLQHPVLQALENSSGGVCVPKICLSKALSDFCTKENISLWVFGYADREELQNCDITRSADVFFLERPGDD